jgi:lipopolysaccharide export system permease protein
MIRMLTTFDRYLLKRYLSVFAILFASTFGLFVVIDGFTNVDAFQETAHGTLDVLLRMAGHYLFQSSAFFDMIAPILAVISAMVVFALLVRHSEIHPMLAAGVPIYRLLVPVVLGAIAVKVLVFANRELVIPRIAHHLQAERGEGGDEGQSVTPVNDYASRIRIDGSRLFLAERRLSQPNFVLPVPEIVHDLATLKAREASYCAATPRRPAGWVLRDATPRYAELNLTEAGRQHVLPMPDPADIFVATEVSFDQLLDRERSRDYTGTLDLVRRIHNPAYGTAAIRGTTLQVHTRLIAPLANVLSVLVAIPLIVRRESRSLVLNLAVSTGVLIVVYGAAQACLYLGRVNLIPVDLAAWAPAIAAGTLAAWLTGTVQT